VENGGISGFQVERFVNTAAEQFKFIPDTAPTVKQQFEFIVE
jgi:hypothetical protein